jgi:hypothetical protein
MMSASPPQQDPMRGDHQTTPIAHGKDCNEALP